MNNQITSFKQTKDDIFLKFGVENKYFLNMFDDYEWEILSDGDINMVKYQKDDISKTNLIIKKNNNPFIIEKDGYTMIIAIDCVKIAFVFKNDLKR